MAKVSVFPYVMITEQCIWSKFEVKCYRVFKQLALHGGSNVMAILVDECNALPRPSAEVLTSGVESLFLMAGRRRLPDGGTLITYRTYSPYRGQNHYIVHIAGGEAHRRLMTVKHPPRIRRIAQPMLQ